MIIIKTISEWRLALTVLFFVCVSWWLTPFQTEATLNCNITSTCVSPNITLLRMSSTTNAHVAIGTSTDYGTNLVCCDYVSTMTNACGGAGVIGGIVNLSSTTNAHIETSSLSNYPIKACLRVATGGYVSSTIQATDCNGYEETIGSMSSTTNSHMGGPSDYLYKICASAGAPAQSLSFRLSANSCGFGTLSTVDDRYATDYGGNSSVSSCNTISVSTNAQYGYTLSVKGDTLSSGASRINPIGGVASTSILGLSQFGIAVYASGGSGVVLAPYATDGSPYTFAYAADATTTDDIAQSTVGDDVVTHYGVIYLANISPSTMAGTYSAALTYVLTAEY